MSDTVADEALPAAPVRLVLFVGAAVRPDDVVTAALARDGVRTLWLSGPSQALQAGRMACFDAVVLDGALAQGGAAVSLSRLRSALRCPVLVLGAVADEIDEILALELGADAFLAQPLAPRRLRAHLGALMRRPAPVVTPDHVREHYIEAGGWVLDAASGRLLRGSRQVPLTSLQVCLLKCLLASPGQMVAKPELVAALPRGASLQARSVDVYVHRLRMRLREQAVEGLAIEAVRGRGWLLRLGTPEFAATAA